MASHSIELLLCIMHCFKFLYVLDNLIIITLRENIFINLHFFSQEHSSRE